jgi:hypothetical protein
VNDVNFAVVMTTIYVRGLISASRQNPIRLNKYAKFQTTQVRV